MNVTAKPLSHLAKPANDQNYGSRPVARGDMADMLEDMQAAEERFSFCGDSLDKSLAIEFPFAAACQSRGGKTLMVMLNEHPPVSSLPAKLFASPDHVHEEHDHKGNGMLGGHLGLEGGHHLTKYLSEARAGLLAIKANTNQAASDGLDTALNKVSPMTCSPHEAAAHVAMSTGLQAATAAVGGASGILGLMLLKSGIEDVAHAIQHKEIEHGIEGANAALVGTRSVAAGIATAGHLIHSSAFITQAATIASSTLTPLGVIHGSIDAGLGVKDVVQGIRHDDAYQIGKGVLSVGLGSSLVAAAVGAGLPAILVAGAFLIGKVVHAVCVPGQGTDEAHSVEDAPGDAGHAEPAPQPRQGPVSAKPTHDH